MVHSYASKKIGSCEPAVISLLLGLQDWTSLDSVLERSFLPSREEVIVTLRECLRLGFGILEGSAEAERDEAIASGWLHWQAAATFHFLTKDAAYVRGDASREERLALVSPGPAPDQFKAVAPDLIRLGRVKLPQDKFGDVLSLRSTHRRFSSQAITLHEATALLQYVWGVQGYLSSPMFGELPRKTSPSGGARHPIEVYLVARRVEGLASATYYYHPNEHGLQRVGGPVQASHIRMFCADQVYPESAAALFVMTAVLSRTRWKYPHPRAYRVVLLDAGHLGQTFCLVATALGLAPFVTAALSDTAIEDHLQIDGIEEVVVYLGGVGQRLE